MFTLSEIEIIMQKRRTEMIDLLKELEFRGSQNWQGEIDPFLTGKVCCLMKSESIFEGYSFLLKAAGIQQSYSETENEKLAKIVMHKQEIQSAIIKQEKAVYPTQYESRYNVSPRNFQDLSWIKKDIEELGNTAKQAGYFDEDDTLFSMHKKFRDQFKKLFFDLEERIEKLPDFVPTGITGLKQSYTEDKFLEFLKEQTGNYKSFIVSVSREKIEERPDPSLQFRKFTEEEASKMLDVLEKLNAIINRL